MTATTYPPIPHTGPVVVTRDGQDVSPELDNSDAAFVWLLRNQGQSVHYALTYAGYAVRSAWRCQTCGQPLTPLEVHRIGAGVDILAHDGHVVTVER